MPNWRNCKTFSQHGPLRKSGCSLITLSGSYLTLKIIIPGRIFLRRMIDTTNNAKQLDHWVHMTADFRSDLAWWCCFMKSWNGRAMMQVLANTQPPLATITTDMSGSWGILGGSRILDTMPLARRMAAYPNSELLPIILAIATWGPHWCYSTIKILCDNMAVVNIIIY